MIHKNCENERTGGGGGGDGYRKLNEGCSVESMGMVCFDISMMKENKRARAGPESSSDMNSSKWKKQQQSQSVGNRKNWCSLQTATETSEVDPFVAFKSVFSFL